MGLAVLPARLKEEMEILAEYLVEGKDIRCNEKIEKHAEWAERFLPNYGKITADNVTEILHKEIGHTFVGVPRRRRIQMHRRRQEILYEIHRNTIKDNVARDLAIIKSKGNALDFIMA